MIPAWQDSSLALGMTWMAMSSLGTKHAPTELQVIERFLRWRMLRPYTLDRMVAMIP
jgi:hypothetical protein